MADNNDGTGNKLSKSLASQDQMGQKGTPIAGDNTGTPFRDAPSNDWAKMTSDSHRAPDGTKTQTHWNENTKTGERTGYKTKISYDNGVKVKKK